MNYKRIVDNKMRWHGDTDTEKHVIRINKSKKKNKDRGEIIDTIVHEETHAAHPRMHEKTVRKHTIKKLKRLSRAQKQKLYSRYNWKTAKD